jgi:hypothetical protein
MFTRKSGILALVLSVAVLGACDDDEPIVQPDPATIQIQPNPVPALAANAPFTLVAITANAPAGSTISWSSSNPNITVTQAGVVTCTTAGAGQTGTITATISGTTPPVQAAVAVSCTSTGPGPITGQPTISIGSITQGGTTTPVNPGNVGGVIDVTLNVDIPAGVAVSRVEVDVLDAATNNLVVDNICSQAFTSGSSSAFDLAAGVVPVTIVCTIDTGELDANGLARIRNGTYRLRAQVIGANGQPSASAISQTLVFNNQDMIRGFVTTTRGPVISGPASTLPGTSWRGGDVTVTLVPAIYSGAQNGSTDLANIQVTLNAAGNSWCGAAATSSVAPNCNGTSVTRSATRSGNTWTATFPAGTAWTAAANNGVGDIESQNVTIAAGGTTIGGNQFIGGNAFFFGPPAQTPPATSAINFTTNPLRLDNLAPRVTSFAIVPNFYVNGAFAFGGQTAAACPVSATDAPCYRTVDFGSDSQTTQFNVQNTSGTTVAGGSNVQNPSTVAETPTATELVVQAVVVDALQNSRTVYGSTPGTAPATALTGAGAANLSRFGVDLTAPTIATTGPANNATAPAPGAINSYTFTASDAGAGPSGVQGFSIKVEEITPTGTRCLNPTNTATVLANCTTNNGFVFVAANPATVTLPDNPNAYYRVTARARDIAGNESAPVERVQLRDFQAPVAGAIATPSSITGGQSISFSAPLTDNVELGDILPAVGYEENAVNVYLANPRQTIGTYGFDLFNNTSPGVFTINPFIRSIETTAGNLPSGTISRATEVQMAARDVAGVQLGDPCPAAGAADDATTQNCRLRTASITSAVAFGIGGTGVETSWSTGNRPFAPVSATNPNGGGTAFSMAAPNPATVCSNIPVGANAGCNVVTATSTVLTATATGPAQTFANPFPGGLSFYFVDPVTGRSFQIPPCTNVAGSATDNTTNGTRTWTWSCTVPAANFPAGAYTLFALGSDTQGRALMSNTQALTVTSD